MQGRKSSRRKSRGCKSTPTQLTASGRADRFKAFQRFPIRINLWVIVRHMGLLCGLLFAGFPCSKGKIGGYGRAYEPDGKESGIMGTEAKRKESKRKFALWARESSLDLARKLYKADNCASTSEFIEKAILFYAGYLSAEDNKTYLPNIVTSTLKSIVAESDHRQNRMMFKLAVELAMTMNVIAASSNIDKISLERLRGECVKEVKRLNGFFSFDDAVDWQRGWEEND